MQFQIGDQVVHSVHGVGTIKTIKRQQFGGNKTLLYYEVVTAALTVWVPADTEGLRLRAVVSRSALEECRNLLTSEPVPLDKNHRIRQMEISTRLKDGSFPARCAMFRDLTAQSRSKPLGATEDALLRRIAKAVCDEWAASAGVSVQVALREIEGLLQPAATAS